jgi:hypothetical protein
MRPHVQRRGEDVKQDHSLPDAARRRALTIIAPRAGACGGLRSIRAMRSTRTRIRCATSSLDSAARFEQASRDRTVSRAIARSGGNPVHRKQWCGLRGESDAVIHNRCELFSAPNQVSERIE